MITLEQSLMLLTAAHHLNLNWLEEGQADIWHLVLNREMPEITYPLAEEALGRLSATRSVFEHNTKITPGDLRREVNQIFKERIEADRLKHGHLTPPEDVPPGLNPAWLQTALEVIRGGGNRADATLAACERVGIEQAKHVEDSDPVDLESKSRLSSMAQNALKPVPGR